MFIGYVVLVILDFAVSEILVCGVILQFVVSEMLAYGFVILDFCVTGTLVCDVVHVILELLSVKCWLVALFLLS